MSEPVPGLFIYTLYDHPRDYPEEFVLRKFQVADGQTVRRGIVIRTFSYQALKARLPADAAWVERHAADPPQVLGSWLSAVDMPELAE